MSSLQTKLKKNHAQKNQMQNQMNLRNQTTLKKKEQKKNLKVEVITTEIVHIPVDTSDEETPAHSVVNNIQPQPLPEKTNNEATNEEKHDAEETDPLALSTHERTNVEETNNQATTEEKTTAKDTKPLALPTHEEATTEEANIDATKEEEKNEENDELPATCTQVDTNEDSTLQPTRGDEPQQQQMEEEEEGEIIEDPSETEDKDITTGPTGRLNRQKKKKNVTTDDDQRPDKKEARKGEKAPWSRLGGTTCHWSIGKQTRTRKRIEEAKSVDKHDLQAIIEYLMLPGDKSNLISNTPWKKIIALALVTHVSRYMSRSKVRKNAHNNNVIAELDTEVLNYWKEFSKNSRPQEGEDATVIEELNDILAQTSH